MLLTAVLPGFESVNVRCALSPSRTPAKLCDVGVIASAPRRPVHDSGTLVVTFVRPKPELLTTWNVPGLLPCAVGEQVSIHVALAVGAIICEPAVPDMIAYGPVTPALSIVSVASPSLRMLTIMPPLVLPSSVSGNASDVGSATA